MTVKTITKNNTDVAVVQSDELVIKNAQDMLDLIAIIGYDHQCEHIAINKEAITEEFFKLSSGIAGEILQKIVNYRKKLAIIGDFSEYISKPLRDFIYESNNGNAVFFVSDKEEALDKLASHS